MQTRPYSEIEASQIERQAIMEILTLTKLEDHDKRFTSQAMAFYPELRPPAKKQTPTASKEPSTTCFLEAVGQHLWHRWNRERSEFNQNQFITYLCRMIYGKSASLAKHGDEYHDLFNDAVLCCIKAMPKYNPERLLTKADGTTHKARIFSYYYMRLGWDLRGLNAKLVDYNAHYLGVEDDEAFDLVYRDVNTGDVDEQEPMEPYDNR